ncbi:MAG: histidine phosphatase family protein, partial [Bacilli bacterium]
RLREVGGGLLEGTTVSERVEQWGEDWASQPLGREESHIVQRRIRSFLAHLESAHPGETVYIISHGALIRAFLEELTPTFQYDTKPKNTAVTTLHKQTDSWQVVTYNCQKHIPAMS